MSEGSNTEIEIKMKIEDEFCATLDNIKCEEERQVDIEVATLPEKYEVWRTEAGSRYSDVSQQSNKDVSLSLRCRFCAMPCSNMVDVFSSPEAEDILEKIQYSLCIMVTETDTLPKQICRSCLEELERCYRFHKTVAEAEKQLHALDKLASMKSGEMERNADVFPLCNEQRGPTGCNNIDASLRTTTTAEEVQTSHSIVKGNVSTASWGPCTVWLPITKTRCESDSDAENDGTSPSDTEARNLRSTTDIFDSAAAIVVPKSDEQSTCDPGVHIENPDDFALAHSRKQLHKCNICAKTFKWQSHLTRHIAVHNTDKGLELHKCNVCAKTFKWKSRLTKHSLVHKAKGRELYECDTCAKTFKWKTNLIRHSVLHMDEGPNCHECNTCGQTFTWKFDLTEHSKIHTNKGLYSCEYCGKKFVQKAVRDRHHLIHSKERPFKCSVCQKSFSDQANLKRHAAVHSEERNYPCSLCDKSFKLSTNRKEHMIIHTRSKPWHCSYCTKTFMRELDLGRHLRNCQKRS